MCAGAYAVREFSPLHRFLERRTYFRALGRHFARRVEEYMAAGSQGVGESSWSRSNGHRPWRRRAPADIEFGMRSGTLSPLLSTPAIANSRDRKFWAPPCSSSPRPVRQGSRCSQRSSFQAAHFKTRRRTAVHHHDSQGHDLTRSYLGSRMRTCAKGQAG